MTVFLKYLKTLCNCGWYYLEGNEGQSIWDGWDESLFVAI
jgi:hypothetical protein